jgi:hypothetical protein
MNSAYRLSRVTTPATSMALVSLSDAKTHLGISDNTQDAAITEQIAQVSAAVHSYCDRVLVQQTYQDIFRAFYAWLDYGKPLRTRQYPLAFASVTVTEDGTVLGAAAWEAQLEAGALYRLDGVGHVSAWAGTSVVIDYDGGYDPIPDDVQAAALEWLSARRMEIGRDPMLRSEVIPDVISQTWATRDASTLAIPPGVRDLLAPYRYWSV